MELLVLMSAVTGGLIGFVLGVVACVSTVRH